MTERIFKAIKNIIDDQSKLYFCYELKYEECHKIYDILKDSGIDMTSDEIEESRVIWNSAYRCMNEAYAEGKKSEGNFIKEMDKEKDIKQLFGIVKSIRLVNSLLLKAVNYINKVEGTFNKLIMRMQTIKGELWIPEQTESLEKQIKDNKKQIETIYGKVRELNQSPKEVFKYQLECGVCKRKFTKRNTK